MMPETATINAHVDNRVGLRAAQAALAYAQGQLAALERSQEQARSQSWNLASQVENAQSNLAKLREREPARIATAFVDHNDDSEGPIPEAENALRAAQDGLERIRKVEEAPASQVTPFQHRIADAKRHFQAALAEYVTTSPEYARLTKAHGDTWTRLRSIRAALAAVNSACGAQMPTPLFESAQRSESLSIAPGAAIDTLLVENWRTAMAKLAAGELDAPLPRT